MSHQPILSDSKRASWHNSMGTILAGQLQRRNSSLIKASDETKICYKKIVINLVLLKSLRPKQQGLTTAVSCTPLPRAQLLPCDFKRSISSPEGQPLLCRGDIYGAVMASRMFLFYSLFERPDTQGHRKQKVRGLWKASPFYPVTRMINSRYWHRFWIDVINPTCRTSPVDRSGKVLHKYLKWSEGWVAMRLI